MLVGESSESMPRRAFLAVGLGAMTLAASTALAKPASASGLWYPDWRFCNKCFGLVRNLQNVSNRCPAGGRHVIQGWTFGLEFTNNNTPHASETPNKQSAWLQCSSCGVLYYRDFPGVCAGRGGAVHLGKYPQSLLPHDLNPTPGGYQPAWRFCFKCSSLYFDGYQPNRGVCPGNPGWGHAAAGYLFQLPVYSYT